MTNRGDEESSNLLRNFHGNLPPTKRISFAASFSLIWSEGNSVMADKGFTMQDLLPLGTSLNIPPFLGQFDQMSPENVKRTQQIASVRYHVERAINRIKNYKLWNGVIPLSLFGLVNQMWSICSFLSNLQDPPISTNS